MAVGINDCWHERLLPLLWGDMEGFQGLFDGLRVIAVNYLPTTIKYDQRHDISVKMIVPFTVELMVFLDISNFKGNAARGEKTFRLGTVASAIGGKDNNALD